MSELELSDADLKTLLEGWTGQAVKLEAELAALRRKISTAQARLAAELPEATKKKGRNKFLIQLVLGRGAATAAEIAKETSIPLSSVYLVLKDADAFSEGGDGKWTLKKA